MELILSFEHPAAGETALTGGKGANLSQLRRAGFPVPPGFVVTARAYRDFIGGVPGLDTLVANLDHGNAAVLHGQCAAIRDLLKGYPLPGELRAELAAQTPPLLTRGPVSVRSSSTLEDLAGAAFAGQHDTYLNVTTAADVEDAVRRCFASLWEDRAVRYRHERGYAHGRAAMAVVVQSMVASDVAGVAFGLNPVTGDLGQIVVNAAFGLGETVVSGEGQVDQFVLDKKTGAVREALIGEKTHVITSAAAGTETREVPAEQRNAASLDAAALGGLFRLCIAVERFYGFPQDMEWAVAGGELFLLQARPVTKFPPRWTRQESAERFPNAVTPLCWDFAGEGFHESLAHSLKLMGLPPFEGHWFERHNGYIYGNQTAVGLFTSGSQVAFDSLADLRAMVPLLRDRYRWVLQLPVTWARDLDHYLLTLGALGAQRLDTLGDGALWEHILAIDALGRSYFLPNIAISITQGILHRTLFRIVALVAGPDAAPQLYDGLTRYCETKTNLVNRDLYALAALAGADGALRALIVATDRRLLWEEGRLGQFPAFAAAFGKFIGDHGHREVDFDPYYPPWVGQPWVVLENLRLLLLQGQGEDPAVREAELREQQREAEKRFFGLVPEDLRYLAAEILRLARAYTSLDDLEHYQTTRLSVPFRAALVELGRRLIAAGVLDAAEDVFFLHKGSLAAFVSGTVVAAALRAEGVRNKADYLAWRDATPPWSLGEESRNPAVVESGAALVGIPGSPGTGEGTVFIVRSVEDFPRFPAGAVLVARTTNPAWTPLFYSACAVITESGGPLSHGAVVAREVGLPAVMAVRGALGLLREGERVRVDGSRGVVTRL